MGKSRTAGSGFDSAAAARQPKHHNASVNYLTRRGLRRIMYENSAGIQRRLVNMETNSIISTFVQSQLLKSAEQTMPSAKKILTIQPTHVGRGLFARKPLESDQVIGEVTGVIHLDSDYGSDYCIDVGDDAVMEPKEPYRLLNHSCEPNCELILWKKRKIEGRRIYRVWVQTLRPIEPGEELTIDYCWPASNAIQCECGSKNCRGWIVHPEELEKVMQANGGEFGSSMTRRPR
jgi:hypothetical protein